MPPLIVIHDQCGDNYVLRRFRLPATIRDVAAPTVRRELRPGDYGAIVEREGKHAGSLAMTDEGDGVACVRFFVLEPELRGEGLGRRLLRELLDAARARGFERVVLETFSELTAAAHLYREHGFQVTGAETGPRWGRAEITYQRYELALPSDPPGRSASRQHATKPIV